MRLSRLRNKLFLFILLAALVTLGMDFYHSPTFLVSSYSATSSPVVQTVIDPTVEIGTVSIPVDLATSSAAVRRGLSGRPSLDWDRGVLFIFQRPARYQFWMPDMHFPIDIIWIADNRIVDVDQDVSPKFDPLHPIFYRPSQSINRVLEVNAGWFAKNNLKIGDEVNYKNIQLIWK